jgi:hypothetical protein
MKISLTQEHVDTAIIEETKSWTTTRYCPVFQALRSAGIPIKGVGFSTATLENGEYILLPREAEYITRMPANQWNEIEPFTFEVDYNED